LADGGACKRDLAIPRAGKSPMVFLRESAMTLGDKTAEHGPHREKFQTGENLLFETTPNASRNSDQRRRTSKQRRRC
jgi:hypothetical protein